jgi:two-component system cell cycle sensor histidine kinase/response regulator CckA
MPSESSGTCPRCRKKVAVADAYCRACGCPLDAPADYGRDLGLALLDALPVGVFTLDLSGRVRFWNRAMELHTGSRRREVLGHVVFDLLPHLQPYAHRVLRVTDQGLPFRLDQVTHGEEQDAPLTETFWFGPLLLEEEAAVLGVMEDITQKVRVDNQLIRSERLAAIGELAAGVAHNFNNILAAIGGDAQLLKLSAEEQHLPREVADAAQQIIDETLRGGRVAHDLLSFARGAEPHIQRLDLAELVRDVARLIRNHPAARAVSIQTDIEERIPDVDADPNLLHQVFFNLMLNGLQAMPGGGTLHVSAVMREHDHDPATGILDVKFHDTGVGIPREHLKRVFDPFYSRRRDGTSGSGLGLPVSLAMIKSIGGDIQIASAEGIGTTVSVSLPIVERRAVRRTGGAGAGTLRALVVDDDPNVRRTLTTLLTRRGFEVVNATDGDEALARIEEAGERPFHVALMEVMVPRGDAALVTERLRAAHPEAGVVLLTGLTDPTRLNRALEAGAQVSFSKPPNFTELLAAVESLAQAHWQKECQIGPPA